MKISQRLLTYGCALAVVCLLVTSGLAGQDANPIPNRITQAPDAKTRVTLTGNVHPLARAENSDANAWWEKRRKLYNIALVLAGFGAFAAYAAVLDHFSCSGPDCRGSVEDTEITLFTIMFQALGYLVAMGVANVLFGLGALSEQLFRPKNRRRWRRACFVLGVCFSVALPFLVPVLVALRLGGRQ